MKTIISPTDFSTVSLNAVNYAADMASVLGMSLSLVHVCALPIATADGSVPAYPFELLLTDAEKNIAELKNRLVERTGGNLKIYTEVREGFVVPEIHEYCNRLNPYAIVVGTEKAKGFERVMTGATTFSAMTNLPWPVIIVPEDSMFSGIRKIGLACDLKDVTNTIPVKELKKLVNEFHAEFHVLHVDDDESSFTPEEVSESAFLQEMIGDLNPVYHFMDGSDVEKTICEFAEKHDFDMLIVSPKKHTVLNRLFHHSHSKRLVLQAHIPVLAIHEQKK